MQQARFVALDVLRGLTVAFMIVVNTPGSWEYVYAPLLHATWHGFTLTDLVFPTFLFAVGNALSFTLPKNLALGPAAFWQKTLRRTALIFLIGILLYWLPFFRWDASGEWQLISLSQLRIPGVLQRIALCFCLASLLLYYLRPRAVLVFCGGILLAYWAILTTWGDLSLQGNVVRKLDLYLLGPQHLYKGEGIAFDPEGLLSSLPACVNVLAGYFAGVYLQQHGASAGRGLLRYAAVLVIVALVWHTWLPINKKLWTSSYVLLGVGLDLGLLAGLLWLTGQAWAARLCHPFQLFGRNTLFIYVLSQVLVIAMWTWRVNGANAYDSLYLHGFVPWAGNFNGSLLFALTVLGCCWGLAWYLDRRGWHWRL